jgi:hypothetical protein
MCSPYSVTMQRFTNQDAEGAQGRPSGMAAI